MPEQKPNAFATLVTNDGYVEPAIVLASTLRRLHHSGTAELVVFVAQGALSASSLATLGGFFDQVIPVLPIRTGPRDRYTLDEVLGRSDLHSALTKIRLFDPAVTGRWKTIVYLDADTVPLQPIAELFGALGQPSDPHRVHLAAAPDAGWPDAFNSGVLVLRADADVYNGLVERLERDGSFDGADQGLLNTYFSSFSASGTALPLTPPASTSTPGLSPLATPTSEADHLGSQTQSEPKAVRLPFAYNVTASASYTYAPAFG
ncbi:glycosyltransferase family 8 protein [Gonapodya prolifera JEL478]|uniref:Glycosyltransferase family 8 protein n=1 Tax=Gonapodya prolifera (strain JEL478) TaxID=1344416 RepID=A0A139AFH1_GONPJ|nr:glycosyltransferase family 8 protein [Gonapodya prolifera JEL478]|eukprot:KXS15508.1 glycosyltransferase family 8 protein [Gonapodya prolifera JEL478]